MALVVMVAGITVMMPVMVTVMVIVAGMAVMMAVVVAAGMPMVVVVVRGVKGIRRIKRVREHRHHGDGGGHVMTLSANLRTDHVAVLAWRPWRLWRCHHEAHKPPPQALVGPQQSH